MSADGWYDGIYDDLDAIEARIYRTFPDMREPGFWHDPPIVRLMCPRDRSTVATVSIQADHNWHLSLETITQEEAIVPAEPLGDSADGRDPAASRRATFRCRLRRCNYRGTFRQDRLLALYAVALQRGTDSIVLPS